MENRHQQILSEIKSLMASVRVQLEQLDVKMAELQQSFEPQGVEDESIDIGLDVFPETIVEVQQESPMSDDPVMETVLSESFVEEEGPAVEEDEPVLIQEEVLVEHDQKVQEVQEVQEVSAQSAVIDVMATKHAWRSDMPGSPVKDVRAAIALVDRALFINSLFAEDAMSFMDALNHINQAETLDEVVRYLSDAHPDWNFDSDVVYRFMMAVRRKVNSNRA